MPIKMVGRLILPMTRNAVDYLSRRMIHASHRFPRAGIMAGGTLQVKMTHWLCHSMAALAILGTRRNMGVIHYWTPTADCVTG
ncbi:MAG TPA: hypothetical protein VIO61_03705 [Anaerolineaceae bacterium]